MDSLKSCFSALAGVFAAAISGATAAPIVFPDSSFESPITTGLKIAPTTIGSWNLTAGSAAIFSTGAHYAQSGSQFLMVSGSVTTNNDIAISLSGFVPGVEYEGSYWLSGSNGTASAQQCAIEIAMFNSKVHTFDYAVPSSTAVIGDPEDNEWLRRSFRFVASAASTELKINVYRSQAATDALAAFDNFGIVPVPKGRPVVNLKSPRKRRSATPRSRIVIRGKTMAQLPVESITVQAGKKDFSIKPGSRWRQRVRLKPGANRISVVSTDIAGTRSKKVSLVVLREAS